MNDLNPNSQSVFWESMLSQYENRNTELQQELSKLQQRLKEMESAIPASNLLPSQADTRRSQMPSTESPYSVSMEKEIECLCFPDKTQPAKISRINFKHMGSISCTTTTSIQSSTSSSNCHCATPATSICTCNSCTVNQNSVLQNIGSSSIRPVDLEYIKRLQESANREKQMKHQIEEMIHRERGYMETLRQADEMWACMESCYKNSLKNIKRDGTDVGLQYEKLNEQLSEENARLGDNLRLVKTKLKHYTDKIQGSLNAELEKERRRSMQLRSQLQYSNQRMANKECSCTKEINNVLNQLKCTTKSICELNIENELLRSQISRFQNQNNDLQQYLINQKIFEAQTLQRIKEMLNVEETLRKDPEVKSENENLYLVTRKLSKTLGDVKNNECKGFPTDLTDTAKAIKVIGDLVDTKGGRVKCSGLSDDLNFSLPPGTSLDQPPTQPDSNKNEPLYSNPNEGQPADLDIKKPDSDLLEDEIGRDNADAGAENFKTEHTLLEDVKIACKRGELNKGREKEETTISVSQKEVDGVTETSGVSDATIANIKESLKDVAEEHIYSAMKIFKELQPLLPKIEQGIEELAVMGVKTRVGFCKGDANMIDITTYITESGMLEVITEGPIGVIETTISFTKFGEIEVTTEITEYSLGYKQSMLSLELETMEESSEHNRGDEVLSQVTGNKNIIGGENEVIKNKIELAQDDKDKYKLDGEELKTFVEAEKKIKTELTVITEIDVNSTTLKPDTLTDLIKEELTVSEHTQKGVSKDTTRVEVSKDYSSKESSEHNQGDEVLSQVTGNKNIIGGENEVVKNKIELVQDDKDKYKLDGEELKTFVEAEKKIKTELTVITEIDVNSTTLKPDTLTDLNKEELTVSEHTQKRVSKGTARVEVSKDYSSKEILSTPITIVSDIPVSAVKDGHEHDIKLKKSCTSVERLSKDASKIAPVSSITTSVKELEVSKFIKEHTTYINISGVGVRESCINTVKTPKEIFVSSTTAPVVEPDVPSGNMREELTVSKCTEQISNGSSKDTSSTPTICKSYGFSSAQSSTDVALKCSVSSSTPTILEQESIFQTYVSPNPSSNKIVSETFAMPQHLESTTFSSLESSTSMEAVAIIDSLAASAGITTISEKERIFMTQTPRLASHETPSFMEASTDTSFMTELDSLASAHGPVLVKTVEASSLTIPRTRSVSSTTSSVLAPTLAKSVRVASKHAPIRLTSKKTSIPILASSKRATTSKLLVVIPRPFSPKSTKSTCKAMEKPSVKPSRSISLGKAESAHKRQSLDKLNSYKRYSTKEANLKSTLPVRIKSPPLQKDTKRPTKPLCSFKSDQPRSSGEFFSKIPISTQHCLSRKATLKSACKKGTRLICASLEQNEVAAPSQEETDVFACGKCSIETAIGYKEGGDKLSIKCSDPVECECQLNLPKKRGLAYVCNEEGDHGKANKHCPHQSLSKPSIMETKSEAESSKEQAIEQLLPKQLVAMQHVEVFSATNTDNDEDDFMKIRIEEMEIESIKRKTEYNELKLVIGDLHRDCNDVGMKVTYNVIDKEIPIDLAVFELKEKIMSFRNMFNKQSHIIHAIPSEPKAVCDSATTKEVVSRLKLASDHLNNSKALTIKNKPTARKCPKIKQIKQPSHKTEYPLPFKTPPQVLTNSQNVFKPTTRQEKPKKRRHSSAPTTPVSSKARLRSPNVCETRPGTSSSFKSKRSRSVESSPTFKKMSVTKKSLFNCNKKQSECYPFTEKRSLAVSSNNDKSRVVKTIKVSPIVSPPVFNPGNLNNLDLLGELVDTMYPPCAKVVSSDPMNVTDMRRLSSNTLLIKWVKPFSRYVTGYEILVNGIIRTRVHSSLRTSAILHNLKVNDSIHVTIFAITKTSRCYPPAIAIYQT